MQAEDVSSPIQFSLAELLLWTAAFAFLFALLQQSTACLWFVPPVICTTAGWKVWPDWLGICVGLSWGLALDAMAVTVLLIIALVTW